MRLAFFDMQTLHRQNNNFDFLRLFAAICICLTHSFSLSKHFDVEPLMAFTNNRFSFASIGLTIFFSISGFLIYKSSTSSSLTQFVWKRLLRIQPLLIVMCFLLVFVVGPLMTILPWQQYFSSIETYTYFRNALPIFGAQFNLPGVFVTNPSESGANGSIWTLVIEERLYLFVGLFYILKNKKRIGFQWAVLGINILCLANEYMYHQLLVPYLGSVSFSYAVMFINSGFLYSLNIDIRKYASNVFVWVALLLFFYFGYNAPFILNSYIIPLMVILFALVPSVLNNIGSRGDFTYGIYLFSFPVQQILLNHYGSFINPWFLFGFTMLICFPLAVISWHCFEKKILAYKYSVK
jgi:peptidoglycan/LPS O-acetylase OafA/YrhL